MCKTLPITILTGFLGSGKTTLLNRLLQHESFKDTAVLVNEFGEVGLDHLLAAPLEDEDIVLLNAGCLCCTIRTDLIHTLNDLWQQRVRQGVPQFQRVLIETTGLADPAPILHTLLTEDSLNTRFHIDGIVTTVDSVHAETQLTNHIESLKQVAIADRLALTKPDLVGSDVVASLCARLGHINRHADVLVAEYGVVDPDALLGVGDAARREFLTNQGSFDSPHHANEHRHDDKIGTFYLESNTPILLHRFVAWIERLLASQGDRVLRLKGILNVEGVDRPTVVHGVQHVFHPLRELPRWPDADRRSRVVLIGRDLSEVDVKMSFEREVLAGAGIQ